MRGVIALFLLSACSSLPPIEGVRPPSSLFSLLWVRNTDPTYNTGNLPIALNSPLIRDGIVYAGDGKGFMGAWRARDGKLLWKGEDGGSYHSGIGVFGENVIYGNSEGRIFSRSRISGKLVYSVDVGGGVEGTPTLHRGRAFFHLRNHKILCMDAKTGKILWSYRRSVSFLTTTQGVSEPVVHEDALYVGFADGVVAAFSVQEGVLLWERKVVSGTKFVDVDTSPVLYRGKLIVGENGSSLSVLNLADGSLLRRFDYPLSRTPLVYGGHLVLGTTDGELIFLGANFEEVLRLKVSGSALGSLAPWKGFLAVATLGGSVHLVDGKKGGGTRETFLLGHGISAVFGDLSSEGGKLAVLSSRHRLYVFR